MKNILKVFSPRKKVHIFYKHVHAGPGKNRPNWFSHEGCFLNLLRSIGYSRSVALDIELTILFDGTQKSYESDFIKKYYEANEINLDFELIKFNLKIFSGGSQRLAGLFLLEEIERKNFGKNDYIYILENDYLHVFDWIYHLDKLISSAIPFDYVSLYDHGDKYPYTKGFHRMHVDLMSKLYVAGDRHWRTVPSTCYSFIVSGEKFREDLAILRSDLMDHQVFAELEKKGRIILSPVPGLATHCMIDLLSPCVKWENFLYPSGDLLKKKRDSR